LHLVSTTPMRHVQERAAPAPAPPAGVRGGESRLRIASLNCQCLIDGAELANAVLQAHGDRLDVLALQEVSTVRNKQLAIFASTLRMRVVERSEPDALVGLANALLIREDGPEVTSARSWTLSHPRESRSAVAVELNTGLVVCCTHLDHRDERARLHQLEQLRECLPHNPETTPLVLLGDFNSIRRADYDDAEWRKIVDGRERASIKTETEVVDALELPSQRGGRWDLADCRSLAAQTTGAMPTSVFGARVDYVWLSAAARRRWHATLSEHIALQPEDVTDHSMVVCELVQAHQAAPAAGREE